MDQPEGPAGYRLPGYGWVWAAGINEAGDVAGYGHIDRYSTYLPVPIS